MRTDDLLSRISEKQRAAARLVATWLVRSITRVMRPTPVYIPRYPMNPEEQERVRPTTEHPTRTTDQE